MPAAWRPARWADIWMMRDAVTTPVPPMPGMRMTVLPDQGPSASAGGSGNESGGAGYGRAVAWAGPRPCWATTKDGHSPLMHDLSRLQLPWWIDILVPKSVSTWTSETHVACSA